MKNVIAARCLQAVALLLLALAIVIAIFELRQPSSKYWWRRIAESALTEISEHIRMPIGLSASKLAFQLRQADASQATIRQLAEAAERHGERSLSAAAKIHLARRSDTQAEASLQLAQEAFALVGNELTAWQYATCLRQAGRPVPEEVDSVLLNGADWEYAYLLRIDESPGAVSASVAASRDRIEDPELLGLADAAAESEAVYAHWSQPEVQMQALTDLRHAWMEVEPVASQHRGFAWLASFAGDYLLRTVDGVVKLFTDPGPMEVVPLVSRIGRRFMGTIDALEAIGTAETVDDQILKARDALRVLEKQIYDLESGEMVGSLEREMTSRRNALIARLDSLLSDPRRYSLDHTLVLAAIEGKDPNELFLADAATPGSTH